MKKIKWKKIPTGFVFSQKIGVIEYMLEIVEVKKLKDEEKEYICALYVYTDSVESYCDNLYVPVWKRSTETLSNAKVISKRKFIDELVYITADAEPYLLW